MASLIIMAGANEGDYYTLGDFPLIVGRGEDCPVQIVDDLVSRRHLQVGYREAGDCHYVFDMRSANGVAVNGQRIEREAMLDDGDIIEIGNSKLLFTKADFSDRATAMSHAKQRGETGKGTLIR